MKENAIMCGLPPDKSNRDALLDDGGIDQTALHLPQVRGDDVDVELGELKDKTEIMHCTNSCD